MLNVWLLIWMPVIIAQIDAKCVNERVSESGLKYDSGYSDNSGCPALCTCSKQLPSDDVIVDCSHSHLEHIPDQLPASTTQLLLTDNDIKTLRHDDLNNCVKLERLDISRNRLIRLESGCLTSVTNLQQLFLNDNNLTYDTLPEYVFDRLGKLRVLKIQNNNWMNSSAKNYDRLFSRLSALDDLALDVTKHQQVFGDGFSNLARLRKLSIHGGLYAVLNNTFIAFRSSPIESITFVTSTNLRWLEPMSFVHFPMLSTLDLSYNQGLGIENVSNAWWGLQFTNISKLVLSRIIPEDAVECKITSDFFNFLQLTNITTLFLDKNNIVRSEPILSKVLPNLEHFDFSFNRISNVAGFLLDVWKLKRLKYLDASHQAKRYLVSGVPKERHLGASVIKKRETHNVTSINGNSRSDWTTQCFAEKLGMCMKEILKWGRKSRHDFPLPAHGPWCVPLSPRLEVVNLTASLNVDLYTMPAIIIFGGHHLKKIEYRLNGIGKLSNYIIITTPTNRFSVDFSDNGITCFAPGVFSIALSFGCRVVEIDLSGNSLSEQMANDVIGKTFEGLELLEILSLARNEIQSLHAKTFGHLEVLHQLNLSHNYLRAIDFEFSHMRQLSHLDVSYNLLSSLKPETTQKLSNMFNKRNTTDLVVDFFGNPIQCSCETLEFLHWMYTNKERFVNFNSYSCNLHGSVVLFANISKVILFDLDFKCSKPLALIISGSFFGLLLLFVALSITCYRYRLEIRYLCLRKRKPYTYVAIAQTVYTYDAFVVYDSADRNWVNTELVPHIEGNLGVDISTPFHRLRLCVHERDFPPGEDIIANIWSRMERSRKTILVLSKSFTRSHYCNYEVQLARLNCVEQARNLIIPVLLEPLEMTKMSECLYWVVRKLTYIEWPIHKADRDQFWERLSEAIITYY